MLNDTRLADFLQDGSEEGLERLQDVMELRTQADNYAELTAHAGHPRTLEDVPPLADLANVH